MKSFGTKHGNSNFEDFEFISGHTQLKSTVLFTDKFFLLTVPRLLIPPMIRNWEYKKIKEGNTQVFALFFLSLNKLANVVFCIETLDMLSYVLPLTSEITAADELGFYKSPINESTYLYCKVCALPAFTCGHYERVRCRGLEVKRSPGCCVQFSKDIVYEKVSVFVPWREGKRERE